MFEKNHQSYLNKYRFRQASVEHYLIDYTESDTDTLFVTFEGMLAGKKTQPSNRYPWGGKFLLEEGHALLGIKTAKSCWYRNNKLHKAMESTAIRDILNNYKRVIFYGESMGGYGALAFSSLRAESEVLCFAPQTTMDLSITNWEDRFQDDCDPNITWSGKYRDASKKLRTLKQATIIFDPFCSYDLKHFNRIPRSDRIKGLKAPFAGHGVSALFSKLDLLKPIVRNFVNYTLDDWYYEAIRKRKDDSIYLANMYYMLARRSVINCKYHDAIEYTQMSLKHNLKHESSLELAKKLINFNETGVFI